MQTLYAQTEVYNTLLRTRTDQNAVLSQIRRWLSFCKSFVKRTQLFTVKPEQEDEDTVSPDAKSSSMYKKSTILYVMILDWIRDGTLFICFAYDVCFQES